MEGLRQVFLDFTSFGAGQSGSSEMDSAKFVKLAKVHGQSHLSTCGGSTVDWLPSGQHK